jgi:hypothetical protein
MQEQRQKLKPFAPDPAPIPACRVFFEELLKSDLFVKMQEAIWGWRSKRSGEKREHNEDKNK